MNVKVFDSTLRDGAQAEGISFLVGDKIKIAQALDELGVDFIEAGNPGSNKKDLDFFKQASKLKFNHSKLVAFGSTRRCNSLAASDANLQALLEADTEYVCIFGKSWDFHVETIIGTTKEENLNMIHDSISFLIRNGKKVFYDAEHFFDGFKGNKEYAKQHIRDLRDAEMLMHFQTAVSSAKFGNATNNLMQFLNPMDFEQLIYLYNKIFPNAPLQPGKYTCDHIKRIIVGRVLQSLGISNTREDELNVPWSAFDEMAGLYSPEENFSDIS